jgi:hypothetical protein
MKLTGYRREIGTGIQDFEKMRANGICKNVTWSKD